MPDDSPVISLYAALADGQRARMLRLLERGELAVGELALALQLAQSTMSRNLKALHEVGLVTKRAEGTATLYRLAPEALAPEARRAWELLRDSLGETPAHADDDRRLAEVLAARNPDPKGFFGRVGGEWSGLRRGLFGERFVAEAMLALLPSDWTVADLGCGTGEIAAEIAPFVRKVVAIDREPAMLDAARRRLRGLPNVEVRKGDLLDLAAKAGEFDACVLSLVLHHIGFSERDIAAFAAKARLSLALYRPLRPAIDARGPGLFVARLAKA
ncbi:MAG: metalloregulator ArsR/SmtB family transcription factor [Phycisphaerales bacterium]